VPLDRSPIIPIAVFFLILATSCGPGVELEAQPKQVQAEPEQVPSEPEQVQAQPEQVPSETAQVVVEDSPRGHGTPCPNGMILIPGGPYLLGQTIDAGSWEPNPDSTIAPEGYWSLPNPAQRIPIQTFCIDRYEFPNQAGKPPRGQVNWNQAVELCETAGKRLPTRLEWQAAAQGPEGWLYSYGPVREAGRCNTEVREGDFSKLAPSGSFPDCVSPLGVHDLNGNLSEWVADRWEGPWIFNELYGGPADRPVTAMGGTAWRGDLYGQDSTSRHRHLSSEQWLDDGFRCALTPS
jgi:hypothetical protein